MRLRDRLSNVFVMALSTGLNIGALMMWAPVLSLHLRDLGASDIIIGLANSFWLVLSAVAQYIGGRLADRFGRVPAIGWPGVVAAVTIALCALAPTWQVFVLLYAVYFAAGAVQHPVFSAVVGESVPAERRGWAFGRVELAIGCGVVVGPLLGSLLMPLLGIRALLALSSILFLASASLRLSLLTETKPASAGTVQFAFVQVLRPPLRKVLLILVGFNALLSLTLWGPFVSLHANDAMGLSRPAINQLAAVGSGVGILMSMVAGHAVSRWGPAPVLRLGLPGLAALAVLWSWQRTLPGIVGVYILMYAAFQLAMISSDTFRVTALPEEARGRALGAIGMSSGLFTAPLVPLASLMRTAYGSAAPFFVALLPATVGLISLIGWQRERQTAAPVEVVSLEPGP